MATLANPVPIDFLNVEQVAIVKALVRSPTVTATTAGGTLTMLAPANTQLLTGTAAGFSVALPSALTLNTVVDLPIFNLSSQNVNIKDFGGNIIFTVSQSSICFAYLVDNSTANGQWVFWQSLINEATGIKNYNLTSTTPFTTSSRNPAFAIITGFTLTPVAGTYICLYNASVFYTTTPKFHRWAFYESGVQVADSLRQQDTAHSNQTMMDTTQAIIQVSGADTIDVRVACDNTGSLTVNARTMVLIRLGN